MRRRKTVAFDTSAKSPYSGCVGWVPWRAVPELPRSIEKMVIERPSFDDCITPETTPFNGMELEVKTVKRLARLYGYDVETELLPLLSANMVVLRDIFFHRFGDDADIWWDFYKDELEKLRQKGIDADRIFLLMDVALCEQHLRDEVKAFHREGRKATEVVVKNFDSLLKKLPRRAYFYFGVRRTLEGIRSEVKQAVEKYRLVEPEAKSPLLQLVNLEIIDLLRDSGLRANGYMESCDCRKCAGEAYRQAARLYIGFDFFPNRIFNLAKHTDGKACEQEEFIRAERVKENYNEWKPRRSSLIERLKQYGGMMG